VTRGFFCVSRSAWATATPHLPVERGMVDLREERDLAALQSVDHGEFPERLVAIEHARVQRRHRGFELRPGCRAWGA